MPVLEQQRLPKLEVRAPTADPLLDRAAVARFLEERVSPTGVHEPTVLVLNLEGRFLSIGALYELVVPLGQAVKAGRYGPLSIVISTTEEATEEAVMALADRFDLPIYLSASAGDLDEARPATSITGSQAAVLRALRQRGGRATVAEIAAEVGSPHGAASNVLTDLAENGLVMRLAGAGRRGHVYLDPAAAVPGEPPADPESFDFNMPAGFRDDLRVLAELQGREPGAVLLEAWREFLTKHREQMAAQSRELAGRYRAPDDSHRSHRPEPVTPSRRRRAARDRKA